MMKKNKCLRSNKLILLTLFLCVCLSTLNIQAQEKVKIYNPKANVEEELSKAIVIAKKQNKNILLQIGGNWCPWCIKLHNFMKNDQEIDFLLNANYVVLKVNYSKGDKNKKFFEKLEFPQRFGFPVLVILNKNGKRIHTQNSAYLEKDKSYDRKKIIEFLKNWSVKALLPETYL